MSWHYLWKRNSLSVDGVFVKTFGLDIFQKYKSLGNLNDSA
jgi:hypothetical protein